MTYSSLFGKFFLRIFNIMEQIRDTKLLQKIAVVIKELREKKGVSQETVYNDTNISIIKCNYLLIDIFGKVQINF